MATAEFYLMKANQHLAIAADMKAGKNFAAEAEHLKRAKQYQELAEKVK